MMAQTIQTQRPCRQIALSHRFPSEEERKGREAEGSVKASVGP